jgi:hypothetical protein
MARPQEEYMTMPKRTMSQIFQSNELPPSSSKYWSTYDEDLQEDIISYCGPKCILKGCQFPEQECVNFEAQKEPYILGAPS